MRALFLDRDGVINVDFGHVGTKDRFVFMPGIFELVREANRLGYLVIVVTNQAGIARGLYSEAEFLELTRWMKDQFAIRHARIEAVYYCPHHEKEGMAEYKKVCDCRKPAPGMLFRAAREQNIDLGNSILVGDNNSDLQAAASAGIKRCISFGRQSTAMGAIALQSLLDYELIFGAAMS